MPPPSSAPSPDSAAAAAEPVDGARPDPLPLLRSGRRRMLGALAGAGVLASGWGGGWTLAGGSPAPGAAVLSGRGQGAGLPAATDSDLRPVSVWLGSGLLAMDRLPLLVAERLGFFRWAGLRVTLLTDDALPGGMPATDVSCMAFEQVLTRRAAGASIRAFSLLTRNPQLALLVDRRMARGPEAAHPLDGLRVGIPGFGEEGLALVQQVLPPSAPKTVQTVPTMQTVRLVALRSSADAFDALRRREVDAIVCGEPQASLLEAGQGVVILADTRTPSGARRWYTGPMPGACLVASDQCIDQERDKVQALADATVRSLRWMLTSSLSDWARLLPEAQLFGLRGLYLQALDQVRTSYSGDARFLPQATDTALRIVRMRDARVNRGLLASSFTNDFAARAPGSRRA